MSLETDVKMGQLSALQRFKLIGVLNALPEAQFNQVVLALNPPSGLVPPRGNSKGDRAFDLFVWLESPGGPGLAMLIAVLKEIPSSDIEEFINSTSPRYTVTLDIDADNMDVNQLKQLIRGIGAVIGDDSIRIINVDRGSLKLDITGDPDKLKLLIELFENGELAEIFGVPVASVERIDRHASKQQPLEDKAPLLIPNRVIKGVVQPADEAPLSIPNGVVTEVVRPGNEWVVRVQGVYWHARTRTKSDFVPNELVHVIGQAGSMLLIQSFDFLHPDLDT